jgi:hypothetical protein
MDISHPRRASFGDTYYNTPAAITGRRFKAGTRVGEIVADAKKQTRPVLLTGLTFASCNEVG